MELGPVFLIFFFNNKKTKPKEQKILKEMPVERSSNGAQAHFQFQLCPYVAASAENFGPPLLHKVNYSKFLNKQTHTKKNINGDYDKRFPSGGSRIPSLPLLRLASSRAHSSCSLFLLHLFFLFNK